MQIQRNVAAPVVPDVGAVPSSSPRTRAEFERETLAIARKVRSSTGSPSVALAPFAGTRIAGFSELDLDGLVMVDWARPGTDAQVRAALADPKFWQEQRRVQGGESSSDVWKYPSTAQILAKLQIELGVTNVAVTRFAQKGDTPDVAMGNVDEKTKPFVTRYDFMWNGKPRSIALVSWAITGDDFIPGRPPLPTALLKSLRPDGYAWDYHSADGVGFFSANVRNGLQKASRDLVSNLQPGGAVLLEDPHADAYVNGGQDFSGIHFMRGRARLESYGLREIGMLAPPAGIYGYAGLDPRDRVRAYQKPGTAAPSTRPAIDTSSFVRGESMTYAVSPK